MRKNSRPLSSRNGTTIPNCSNSAEGATPETRSLHSSPSSSHGGRKRLPPQEYVISKFRNHDIVFLGENIASATILSSCRTDTASSARVCATSASSSPPPPAAEIDSLLTGPIYDPGLAGKIFWDAWPCGGTRSTSISSGGMAAQQHPPWDSPRFRVVALNARMHWEAHVEPGRPQ